MSTTRRNFFKRLGWASVGLFLPKWLGATNTSKKNVQRLVILHTNDTHSHIDPHPENHNLYPNQGGILARAALIDSYRQTNEHVLLLDAGDFFQGTPYFNRYHGVLEMKLMSALGYDVVTLGNHDFDIGIEGLLNAKKYANFKFTNANYDFTNTALAGQIEPYHIIQKGIFKIGIFGLGVELNGLVPAANYQGIQIKDPIKSAQITVEALQQKKCDYIICLSHLGYKYQDDTTPSDIKLAQQVSGIDLIIGGHTHTFMDAPTAIQNPSGSTVWIHQVGWAGVRLGVIEIEGHRMNFCQKKIVSKVNS